MFASLTPHLCPPSASTRGTSTVLARLRLALAARAQRRALARLDDRLLARHRPDRATQALAEARRPLWDVPAALAALNAAKPVRVFHGAKFLKYRVGSSDIPTARGRCRSTRVALRDNIGGFTWLNIKRSARPAPAPGPP